MSDCAMRGKNVEPATMAGMPPVVQISNLDFHYRIINGIYPISTNRESYTSPLYVNNFLKNYAGNFNKLYMFFKGTFCLA